MTASHLLAASVHPSSTTLNASIAMLFVISCGLFFWVVTITEARRNDAKMAEEHERHLALELILPRCIEEGPRLNVYVDFASRLFDEGSYDYAALQLRGTAVDPLPIIEGASLRCEIKHDAYERTLTRNS